MSNEGRLYVIRKDIRELLDSLIDTETGEITDMSSKQLEAMMKAESEAVEELIKEMRNHESQANALNNEAQTFKLAADKHKHHAERIEKLLHDYVSNNGSFTGNLFGLSMRKSQAVIIDVLPENLPEGFYRTKYEADKTAIAKAFKEEKTVTGAHIQTNDNLQIKVV